MDPMFEIVDTNPQASSTGVSRSESAQKFPDIFVDEISKLGAWKKYLEDTPEAEYLAQSENLFDLIEQSAIDEDCEAIIDELDVPEESEQKIISIIRTIITIYSKNEKKRYRIGNGWVRLLSRLIKNDSKKLDTYIAFKRIRDFFVPEPGTHGYILRLLLMYHDPELCQLIDNDRIDLPKCTESWINSLFAGVCVEPVRKSLWNYLFKDNDSYKTFFIILEIILVKRNKIIEMKFDAKPKRENTITLFPHFMDTVEIKSVISSASILDMNTPSFFKEIFKNFMFGVKRDAKPKNLPEYLPSSAFQVIQNIHSVAQLTDLYYVVADCRPEFMYDSGRFGSKHNFQIDCNLVTDWSSVYLNAALKTLISIVENYTIEDQNKVKHICIMGSGLEDNDTCTDNVVKALLHKKTKYVSVLFGGYNTVHQLLKIRNELNYSLVHHVEKKCVYCNPVLLQAIKKPVEDDEELYQPSTSHTSQDKNAETTSMQMKEDLYGKVKKRLKQTGKDVKSRLTACINPRSPSCQNESKGISSGITLPIDGDEHIYQVIHEPSDDDDSMTANSSIYGNPKFDYTSTPEASLKVDDIPLDPLFETVSIDEWTKAPDVEKIFQCKITFPDKSIYDGRLIVTHTNIILLRRINKDKASKYKAFLLYNRPIFSILNIRGSSKNEEFLNIIFDMTENENTSGIDVKLLIPQKEAFMNLIFKKFKSYEQKHS